LNRKEIDTFSVNTTMYTKQQLYELLADAWDEIAADRHRWAENCDGYHKENIEYAKSADAQALEWRKLANEAPID